MAHKKTPENSSNLAGGEFKGADEASEARLLDERIARYGVAHARSQAMLCHLREAPSQASIKTAAGLASCGNYLHFRGTSPWARYGCTARRFASSTWSVRYAAFAAGQRPLGLT